MDEKLYDLLTVTELQEVAKRKRLIRNCRVSAMEVIELSELFGCLVWQHPPFTTYPVVSVLRELLLRFENKQKEKRNEKVSV